MKKTFKMTPQDKGILPYSECCGVDMPNQDSDLCPKCKEHTSVVWADENDNVINNPFEEIDDDNTYN